MKNILFFDLDGTLWDQHEVIPESACEAIRLARGRGHEVWINTGRSRAFVYRPQLFSLGIDGLVTGAGTMVEARGTGRSEASSNWRENTIVHYSEIPEELAAETVQMLHRHVFHSILEGRDCLYADVEDFGDDPFVRQVAVRMGEKMLGIRENSGKWSFVKLSCDLKDARDRETGLAWMKQHYTVMAHNDVIMEFVPRGYSKGSGLFAACRYAGIPVERSIVFGDGRNDLEMFDAAGVAVAMGNGSEIARERADLVTKPMDQDGIYEALKKLDII